MINTPKILKTIWAPLGLSAFLVMWTVLASPYSHYGDYWAVIPVLLVLPSVIALHIYLLVNNGWKWKLLSITAVHIIILSVVWLKCLMIVSKDSL